MTLYGFADAESRDLFTTLLGVSGVGPKIALATLAVYDAAGAAAGAGRRRRHRADPGAGHRQAGRRAHGARTARQDRRGRVTAGGHGGVGGHAVRGPVVEALVGLGFAAKQAEEATDKVLAEDPDATTSSALRAALSMLGEDLA